MAMGQGTFSRYLDNGNRRAMNYSAPARYTRSADGRETWTPRMQSSSPRDEMVARNNWPCKFDNCTDRTVTPNVTVIVKRDGKWGHKSCPVPKPAPVVAQSVAPVNNRRMANVAALHQGIFRVEFSGRRNTDPINFKITPDRRVEGAFRFRIHQGDESLGRIYADGRVQIWRELSTDQEKVERAKEALEILLGAEAMGPYGMAYSRESGCCNRCGRDLTDEDRIDVGMGKTCAMKAGY
jgi:hypothetical protein